MSDLNQNDFEAALAEAANEWPDGWFNNQADERRVTVNDRIDGREVMSKMVQVPLDKVGHDYIAQAFRVLFNEFNNRVQAESPAPKVALCLRTPKDVWGTGVWCFSLRDERTSMAFDVFTSPDKPMCYVASTWSVAA